MNDLVEAGKLRFRSVPAMRDVLAVHGLCTFLSEASLLAMAEQLWGHAQQLERAIEKDGDTSRHSQALSDVLAVLEELCRVEHRKMAVMELLTKVRKVLTRKMTVLPFSRVLALLSLSCAHKQTLFTEVASV